MRRTRFDCTVLQITSHVCYDEHCILRPHGEIHCHPNEYVQHFKYLCLIASRGLIKPVIATRSSLANVAATQRLIEQGDAPYGLCICTPWVVNSTEEGK